MNSKYARDVRWKLWDPPRRNSRRGFTITELIGACMLLGVMFSITVPMMMVVARQRKLTEQRQFALQHLENLLETALTTPAAKLAAGDQNIPAADPELAGLLPGLNRSLIVKPVDGEPEARQIVASIRWYGADGHLGAPIQLTAWSFAAKGEE